MQINIDIWKSSVIYSTAEKCCKDLCKLNTLAVNENVVVEFDGDKMIITGRRRKTSKVAKKYIGDPVALCQLIENGIKTAWPE